MGKIFGYTQSDKRDWFSSDVYSDNEIENIKDPEGGGEISLPTAIPSPFARIALVKTAFMNIVKSPDLRTRTTEGNRVIVGKDDERLVSHCLDLAEMLFNMDLVKDKIKIIAWNREAEIEELKAGSDGNKRLAETLELYLKQDKKAYNFDLLARLYLIKYNHKTIGCTSPATLFFTTANDLTQAQIRLTKNYKIFGESYTPLYEREAAFQKYFYLLFKANQLLFSERLKVIDDYLDKSLRILDRTNHNLYQEIKNLDVASFETNVASFKTNYSELDTEDAVEVIGVPLRKRKKEDIDALVTENSDLIIRSSETKDTEGLKPLVLPNCLSKLNSFKYVNDVWDRNIQENTFTNETVLQNRRLPGLIIRYPYLTISDFLEPYLIRLVYPINKEKFFDGNVDTAIDDSKGFILPLKKQFFDYFTSDDLVSSSPNTPEIKMGKGMQGSVKVTLRIPIAKPKADSTNKYIDFERIYYPSAENQLEKPDEKENRGVIVEHQFGVTLYPWVKLTGLNLPSSYRIQLIDRNVAGNFKNSDYTLRFYQNSSESPITVKNEPRNRSTKHEQKAPATTRCYVLEDEFDFIQIEDSSNPNYRGIILPRWPPFSGGATEFSFAIDFGTTNTHIEYKTSESGSEPRPFDITKDDSQIATLFDPLKTSEDFSGTGAIAIREMIDYEFIPETLGGESIYKFPTRTVSGEGGRFDSTRINFALADFNIPFTYEKSPDTVNEIKSNLKWAKSDEGNTRRITAYFEELFLLMRNKVLRGRGKLSSTKIVWFFPSSMRRARKEKLEELVLNLARKYFAPNNNPIGICESLAPFYYYKATGKLPGGGRSPVISVDIGGGTTDVVIFKAHQPIALTSFKFAANAIFGDAFSEHSSASHGLVRKYVPYFEKRLNDEKQSDLTQVLKSIKDRKKSEDIIAFLFSLENHSSTSSKDPDFFSLNKMLSEDKDYKILFLYFYVALIYHISQLAKAELGTTERPRNIIFSGTGSKILKIISSSDKTLSAFTQFIFERVYDEKFDVEGLSIKMEKDIPKEVTCKGGLMTEPAKLDIELTDIKKVLTCLREGNKLKFNPQDNKIQAEIVSYVQEFNHFFLDLNAKFNFEERFDVSAESLAVFKKEINNHLDDYLSDGLKYLKELDDIVVDDKEVEETLFFYPIIGAINNLSSHLSALNVENR